MATESASKLFWLLVTPSNHPTGIQFHFIQFFITLNPKCYISNLELLHLVGNIATMGIISFSVQKAYFISY
jgi:hypothetical protein